MSKFTLKNPFEVIDATTSTNVSTGAIVTTGGLGVLENISVGGQVNYFGSASGFTALKGSDTSNNVTFTLPGNLPAASPSYLISDTAGNFSFKSSSGGVSVFAYTFAGANNQITPANVNGMTYGTGLFEINISVDINATTQLTQFVKLSGILSDTSGWNLLTVGQTGDISGVEFFITSSGQIQYTSLNYPGFVSLTISWTDYIPLETVVNLTSGVDTTGQISPTAGTLFTINGANVTDTITTTSGTLTSFNSSYVGAPTLSALNTNVTTTDAATFYIEGPPVAGTNETITNAYALRVDSGNAYFGGEIRLFGVTSGYSAIKAPDVSNDIILTLPSSLPTVNSSYLVADTQGNLSFTATGGGGGGSGNLVSGIDISGDISQTSGTLFTVNGSNVEDATTASSGTLDTFNSSFIGIPTLSAVNTGVTTTIASTLYIEGPPTAGANETIANAYALSIASGNIATGGEIMFFGTTSGYVSLKAPDVSDGVTLTLPSSFPPVTPCFLIADTEGNLSFTASGGGGGVSVSVYTFKGANNQTTPADIKGMVYTTGFFEINVSVDVVADTNLSQFFKLSGILSDTNGWNLFTEGQTGDKTGVVFTITVAGQIQYTSLDYSPGFVSLTFSWSDYTPVGANLNLVSGADTSGEISQTSGTLFTVNGSNVEDTVTVASGTLDTFNSSYISAPTLSATSTNVTTTSASTLFIEGPPTEGQNQTILDSYSLSVASGNVSIAGEVRFFGAISGYSALKGPDTADDLTLTLPSSLPGTSFSYLVADPTGVLSFFDAGRSAAVTVYTFNGANNQVSPANITGMVYNTGFFEINVSVDIVATDNLTQLFKLSGILGNSGWDLLTIGQTGDITGVIFTITASGQIQYTSLSYPGFVSLKFSWSDYTPLGANMNLVSGTDTSGAISQTSGTLFTVNGSNVEDAVTVTSGTLDTFYSSYVGAPTLSALNTDVTTTVASTLYIEGPPTEGQNQTILDSYALSVASGNVSVGGEVRFFGTNSEYVGLKAPTTPNSATFTLPSDFPSVTGSYIVVDTAGNLSFTQGVSAVTINFTGANDQSAPANITGLVYTSGSFEVNVNVNVVATTNLNALCKLSGILSGLTGWNLTSMKVSGDDTGVTFGVTSTGQVQYTSPNYPGFTSLIFNWVDYAAAADVTNLVSGVNTSGPIPTGSGTLFTVNSAVVTDSVTATSGTLGNFYGSYIGAPTLAATNTGVTTTSASTLYISGPPITGTNETITNKFALNVASGNVNISGTAIISILNLTTPLTVVSGGTGVTTSTGTGSLVLSNAPTFTGTTNIATLNLTTPLAVGEGGTGVTTSTGTGSVVLSGAPTFTGTTSIATLSLTNPLAVASGGTGVTTSTGTGSLVLSSAPTFTGTTNIDTLNLTTPLAVGEGGTGVTTSSGTGSTVLSTSATLTTPTLSSPSISGTISGNISASGILSITNSTASTSTTTGALVVTGGVGIGGAVYSAGIHNISNTTQLATNSVTLSATSGALTVQGDIHLYNGTKNTIIFRNTGLNPPTFTNRSSGAKIVLYPQISSSDADFAIGMDVTGIWYSVASASYYHRFHIGTSLATQISNSALNIPITTQLATTSNTVDSTTGALTVQGDIHLYNGTKNTIVFNGTGVGPPATTNRSAGAKIVLFPSISASTTESSIGIQSDAIWYNVNGNTNYHRFYCGTVQGGYVSSGGFNSTSDYRLKENIKLRENGALDAISKLKIYKFNFNFEPNKMRDGFLAHEVQKIIPYIIDGEKDAIDEEGRPKYQGINFGAMVPILTKSIQELSKTVETQQNEIQSQKSKINKLEAFISSKFPGELV